MHKIIELILNTSLLLIFLQVIWSIFISIIYYFSIPWIFWISLLVTFGLKMARIPPPKESIVQEVLGVDPLLLKNNTMNKDHGNGEQYCMRVVAHRGGGYDFPENSLTAFRNCKDKGCTAIEFDVWLTKDNVPIIFHDSTIDRVTGKHGIIKKMTWDELKDLDISYNHPLKDKFDKNFIEKIPLLHEGIEMCLLNEQRIIFDLKAFDLNMEIVHIIVEMYNKYPKLFERAVVSSFNPLVVYMIRRKEPRIVGGLAWRPYYYSRISYSGVEGPGPARYHNNLFQHLMYCLIDFVYEWMFSRFMYYIVGVSTVLLHKDIINQRVIHDWTNRDVRVIAWTVNLPSEKSHFARLFKLTYLTDTFVG
ncbi:glycerophosphodiester phosphodiesterase 1 [Apis laboriosa]|uniref:glycerophosphodiester phosphodiesterase 1 n=1 Tax=Apis laboriosa TaxID=183418 RepID=UPI001CC7FE28|nr:glycerophosphodiester phosphodiesterase 1 [Apis laboriosa]